MTVSDHRKVFKQLKVKQSKLEKFKKHNNPKERSCGKALKKCTRCGSHRGTISKYTLNLCRRCFRDTAKKIGFKQYS